MTHPHNLNVKFDTEAGLNLHCLGFERSPKNFAAVGLSHKTSTNEKTNKLQHMYMYKDSVAKDKYKYDTFGSLQDKHECSFFWLTLTTHASAQALSGLLHWQWNHTNKGSRTSMSHSLQMLLLYSPCTGTSQKSMLQLCLGYRNMPWLACASSETILCKGLLSSKIDHSCEHTSRLHTSQWG